MTLAHKIRQAGFPVTIFESAGETGGLTASWNIGDITWDKFYHVILLSDSNTREQLRELDLEKEINWVETKTGFYIDEKLYSISNAFEFLSFPPLNLIEKFRLGGTIFAASKINNWKRLEKISVEEWLTKWSGKRTFKKIWLPLLKSKLGDNYRNTSAAFIWATIQRMYSARKAGLKKEMFGYVPGGYAVILNKLLNILEREGVVVRTGHAAEKIYRSGEQINIDFKNGVSEKLDKIILTIPSVFAADICHELNENEKKKLKDIRYVGVVCASVLLKKPLDKYYVTNLADSSAPFTGVIEMSALVDKKEFGGKNLIYLPKYVTPDDSFFLKDDEKIKKEFLDYLLRIYPHISESDILSFRVARAKYVFALSTLNYSEKLNPVQTSIPGLYILNSSHIVNGTLNVNETLGLVKRMLPEIIGG